MGRQALREKIIEVTRSIDTFAGTFIDKITAEEARLRLVREAYRRVVEGKRLEELVLPWGNERRVFVEAFNEAMKILD
jgi:hypothetical protein